MDVLVEHACKIVVQWQYQNGFKSRFFHRSFFGYAICHGRDIEAIHTSHS